MALKQLANHNEKITKQKNAAFGNGYGNSMANTGKTKQQRLNLAL